MPADNTFHSFWVRCACPSPARTEQLTGYRIASAVLQLVNTFDPALAARLHAPTTWPYGIKPYTISPATDAVERGQVRFRVTLLRGSLFGPIVFALTQLGRNLRIDHSPMPVIGLEVDPARNRWVANASIDAIIDAAPGRRTARVLFATPTAFHETVSDERVSAPDASLLIGSLLPRWRGYGSERVARRTLDRLRADVRVADAAVFRAGTIVKGRWLEGFLGEVELRAPDSEAGAALHALLGLAFYSGIGIKTAVGMGQALLLAPSEATPRCPDILCASMGAASVAGA